MFVGDFSHKHFLYFRFEQKTSGLLALPNIFHLLFFIFKYPNLNYS